jgi:drug/metabolite transporter (DMT)-like permease
LTQTSFKSLSSSAGAAAPGVAAATSLALADILSKVFLWSGGNVVTMLTYRSVIGLAMMAVWLRIGPTPQADNRVRAISFGIGILFTALVYCLFKAIDLIDVPTAVLTYFAYPLLTGIVAAITGLERLRWQGMLCALIAFAGLGLMIGAHPAGLAPAGIALALAAAVFRVAVLILTRAYLVRADARVTTWYSVIAQIVVFGAVLIGGRDYAGAGNIGGWAALIVVSVGATAGILFMFVSTVQIGPFRTALIMNLEPLLATVLSALFLGQSITPVQSVGAAVMLAALFAFQIWR